MLQLVRFGNCIHVFNTEIKRFEKSSARRVATALGRKPRIEVSGGAGLTRKQMLRNIEWQKCEGCNLTKKPGRNDKVHNHWIALYSTG